MPKGQFGGSFYDVGVSNTGSPLWNTKRVSARQCTWGGRTSGSYFGKEFSNMGKGQYAHLSYAVGVANKGDALFTRSSESEPALLRSRRHLTFNREDMQSETRSGGRSSVYDDELHNRPSRRLQSGRRPQSASAPDTRRVSHVPSRQPSRPPSNPPSMPPSRHTRCVASIDPSCRGSRAASASASRLHSRRPSKEAPTPPSTSPPPPPTVA
uniref:Uncharacterized protein n=1 Tax=Chrysotila carterae TaxID=13221 RepID=A0A7S4BWR8_CHRCT